MNDAIRNYMGKFSEEIQALFSEVRELIMKSVPCRIEEKLWAKLPSFYADKNFIRVIPFKDHINIEAASVLEHKSQLEQYKIMPKGMLQIYVNQDIPFTALQEIFAKSLIR